jgi:tetratricopeptide (TPR) repeat protein
MTMAPRNFPPIVFPLKITCILGGALALLLLGGMVLFTFLRGGTGAEIAPAAGDFTRQLAEFDRLAAAPEKASAKELNAFLDGLEKKALSVESHLSVLKRRRSLARKAALPPETTGAFINAYAGAADRISGQYPSSEPLAALAAEALFLQDPLITGETPGALENYLDRIHRTSLLPLALSLQVLAGKMADPQSAGDIPGELLDSIIPLVSEKEREQFLVNQGIQRLLAGDRPGCEALINALIAPPGEDGRGGIAGEPAPETLRFAAEFFYDFGDPLRGAELFSRFPGEASLARQADALWRAGHGDTARNIWRALASPQNTAGDRDRLSRSLYNLASTAPAREEKITFLERFFAEQRHSPGSGLTYGLIAYTRLLDSPQAITILEDQDLVHEGLFDLELFKRTLDQLPLDRTFADLWLLLDRHPRDERLYQWGAYYFDRQRQYGETAMLIRTARENHLEGPWLKLSQGIGLTREGRLDEGEALFRDLSGKVWQADANIARILEARRSHAAALGYYEVASGRVTDKKEAARIQLYLARCLRALGRFGEVRPVLERAGELDPDNLNIRLELRRLES